MSARQDDGFRQALRALSVRGATPTARKATVRVVDLSFSNMLYGPEKTWPRPETVEEVAQAEAIRSRRRQKLSDRVEDLSLIGRVARLIRG